MNRFAVVRERLAAGETYSRIARDFGVSRQRVHQMAKRIGATSVSRDLAGARVRRRDAIRRELRRFWPSVFKYVHVTDEHWIWTGPYQFDRIPRMNFKGKIHYVRRLMIEYVSGAEPSEYALLLCDEERCVKPDHVADASMSAVVWIRRHHHPAGGLALPVTVP